MRNPFRGSKSEFPKNKLSNVQKAKRLVLAGLLGATAGTAAIETDQHITHGLFSDHLRSFITDPGYREKVRDSFAKGDIFTDAGDLIHAAELQTNSQEGVDESAEFSPSMRLGERLDLHDKFLDSYFQHSEIWSIQSLDGEKQHAVYIAELDNPAIVNFNEGTEDEPSYDPFLTEDRIGKFTTIPTNLTSSETNIPNHALYSAYTMETGQVEYPDVYFQEKGENAQRIRAGALVLFNKEGRNILLAMDSRDFSLKIGDLTEYGTVQAIESYSSALASNHEEDDISSLRQLVGKSKLNEYSRSIYNAAFVTYYSADGDPKTFIFGLYTNNDTLPTDVEGWSDSHKLNPQDLYSLIREYGKNAKAQSWVVVIPDPGPSSVLFDPDRKMGDPKSQVHSKAVLRPKISIVQLGVPSQ